MKTNLCTISLFVLSFLCLSSPVSAATLRAKVVRVESGNTVVVTNINRPLRIRLKAVAPPDAGQPFSDAAREHLKALVFEKEVSIDYTHLDDGFLEARLMLNGIDIGSQMLRDGVAWFDRSSIHGLTQAEQDLYAKCEQAARDEKRGLWQDSAAVSPWEFRTHQQREAAKLNATLESPLSSRSTQRQTPRTSSARQRLGFTSDDLVGGTVGPGSIAGSPTYRPISPGRAADEWTTYTADAPKFSVRVPGDSVIYTYPILDSEQKIVNFKSITGTNDEGVFTLMWATAADGSPSDGSTAESSAAEATMDGFIRGINQYLAIKGSPVRVVASAERDFRIGNHSGKEFKLTAGPLSGLARVVSRQVGKQRELIALAYFVTPGSGSGADFFNSMKILSAKQ